MEIVHPAAIQAQKRGRVRALNLKESMALALGALGTLARSSGVRTINTEVDGKPVALAIIEDAQFGTDANGFTTLTDGT